MSRSPSSVWQAPSPTWFDVVSSSVVQWRQSMVTGKWNPLPIQKALKGHIILLQKMKEFLARPRKPRSRQSQLATREREEHWVLRKWMSIPVSEILRSSRFPIAIFFFSSRDSPFRPKIALLIDPGHAVGKIREVFVRIEGTRLFGATMNRAMNIGVLVTDDRVEISGWELNANVVDTSEIIVILPSGISLKRGLDAQMTEQEFVRTGIANTANEIEIVPTIQVAILGGSPCQPEK
ncbi:hypothetical protein BD410DRAFT_829473 [Rickenella mellea]|uniref:Uncharacterized protein n=1 Tax=Rickenella mellea TaxID=50990 RepID=A0A4Y7PZK1_9AGAM|nr:hypothetical protein BD410DRAFT_829473 [Rickenella mellea]